MTALVLTVVLAMPVTTLAQVRGEGGISFVVGTPQGQFDTQVDATGFGINAFGGVRFGRNSPVLLGLDLGFLIYGLERRSEAFSLTIPDVRVDVITSNNIVLSHFLLRFQPARGPVRPYFDGLIGFKYLFTETRIRDQTYINDEPIATTTNFDDVALSYGVGGGLSVAVARTGSGGRRGAISLDIGVRYLLGGQASYLRRGSIRRSGGRVSYDVFSSETNLLETRIGASIRF
jgi:Outer membrane protein beta-barrel domain